MDKSIVTNLFWQEDMVGTLQLFCSLAASSFFLFFPLAPFLSLCYLSLFLSVLTKICTKLWRRNVTRKLWCIIYTLDGVPLQLCSEMLFSKHPSLQMLSKNDYIVWKLVKLSTEVLICFWKLKTFFKIIMLLYKKQHL